MARVIRVIVEFARGAGIKWKKKEKKWTPRPDLAATAGKKTYANFGKKRTTRTTRISHVDPDRSPAVRVRALLLILTHFTRRAYPPDDFCDTNIYNNSRVSSLSRPARPSARPARPPGKSCLLSCEEVKQINVLTGEHKTHNV